MQTTYTGTSGNQTRGACSLNNTNWFVGDQGGIYTNTATAAAPAGNLRAVKNFGGIFYVLTTANRLHTGSNPVHLAGGDQ